MEFAEIPVQSIARITNTGTLGWRTTVSVTLPKTQRLTPD